FGRQTTAEKARGRRIYQDFVRSELANKSEEPEEHVPDEKGEEETAAQRDHERHLRRDPGAVVPRGAQPLQVIGGIPASLRKEDEYMVSAGADFLHEPCMWGKGIEPRTVSEERLREREIAARRVQEEEAQRDAEEEDRRIHPDDEGEGKCHTPESGDTWGEGHERERRHVRVRGPEQGPRVRLDLVLDELDREDDEADGAEADPQGIGDPPSSYVGHRGDEEESRADHETRDRESVHVAASRRTYFKRSPGGLPPARV